MQKRSAIEPQVHVEQASRDRGVEPDHWLVVWRIRNLGQWPLQILSGRLPHGQFRCQEREWSPVPSLLPNETAELAFAVACGEPPGTVVENAFLILRVLWLEEHWRAFARLRVAFDELGGPRSITEVITTHKIGFSQ